MAAICRRRNFGAPPGRGWTCRGLALRRSRPTRPALNVGRDAGAHVANPYPGDQEVVPRANALSQQELLA
jgi:hypothetical protein